MNEVVAMYSHGFGKPPECRNKGFGPGFTIIGDLLGGFVCPNCNSPFGTDAA
jgi:hypothetical protein